MTISIKVLNDDPWAIIVQNAKAPANITGMKVTDDGFFHITNTILGSTVAQLDSTGRWTVASDLRMKEDVETASNLLEKALSLNPVHFYYKNQDLEQLPYKLTGFVAQEVEEILPQVIVGKETKFLDYNGLVPVAIGAIQEIKRDYDEKIANLEMQLEELKKTLLDIVIK